MRSAYKILVGKPEGTGREGGTKMLKWNLKKQDRPMRM
jgi:hypothetical protein